MPERRWSEQCLQIDQEIDKLPALEKAILRYRYIFDASWSNIGEKIGYDYDSLMLAHRRALLGFYEIAA